MSFSVTRYRPTPISIHALLAESDGEMNNCIKAYRNFYPRSPCGERPPPCNLMIHHEKISIHALLAESDHHQLMYQNLGRHFYPRSPCGERPQQRVEQSRGNKFLSTLSLRRATGAVRMFDLFITFLSTLSLRRATAKVHKTVGHFCAYETNFMGIASSC